MNRIIEQTGQKVFGGEWVMEKGGTHVTLQLQDSMYLVPFTFPSSEVARQFILDFLSKIHASFGHVLPPQATVVLRKDMAIQIDCPGFHRVYEKPNFTGSPQLVSREWENWYLIYLTFYAEGAKALPTP